MIGNNRYLREQFGSPVTSSVTGQPASSNTSGQSVTPDPKIHVFNASAWATANPGKDVNAAIAAAKAQGLQVKQ
jgi:hypothetical protein